MSLEPISSTVSLEVSSGLLEELNEEMKSSALPVTTFVGVEIVFGFCGNLLILFVFVFHYHKSNFRYFVLCLSFLDTTSTLTTMPGEIVTQTFWYTYPVPIICKIKSVFNVFTVCGSAFCLLIISVDRFRKICRPLKWQIKQTMAFRLCIGQLAISFVLAMPVAFLWGTHSYQVHYKDQNITVTVCEKDERFMYTKYPLVYTIVMQTVISSAMIVMVVLYVFVYRKLLKPTSNSGLACPTINTVKKDSVFGNEATGDVKQACRSSDAQESITSPNKIPANKTRYISENDKDVLNRPLSLSNTCSQKSISTTLSNQSEGNGLVLGEKLARRVKRKTLIMFILTAVFILTIVLYWTLLNLIANDVLQKLSNTQKSLYFFFFRLYFINHVINPILYGILDARFRQIMKHIYKSVKTSVSSALAR